MSPSPLEFPSECPVKVMGRQTPEFRAKMLEIFARHPKFDATQIRERLSRDGTYVALTCTLMIDSRAELDALYGELQATGLVLFAL